MALQKRSRWGPRWYEPNHGTSGHANHCPASRVCEGAENLAQGKTVVPLLLALMTEPPGPPELTSPLQKPRPVARSSHTRYTSAVDLPSVWVRLSPAAVELLRTKWTTGPLQPGLALCSCPMLHNCTAKPWKCLLHMEAHLLHHRTWCTRQKPKKLRRRLPAQKQRQGNSNNDKHSSNIGSKDNRSNNDNGSKDNWQKQC
jgi:hypothetical protein